MGVGSVRSTAFLLLAFFALLTGVMGESVDTDLVGIVIAAICIAIFCIVIIAFMGYCCFRGFGEEADRNSVVGRKDSGSVSTNGPPRWAPAVLPPNRHSVYNVGIDPVIYAVPTSAGNYFMGQHHNVKLRESDRMKYVRQEPQTRRPHQREEEMRVQENATRLQRKTTSQPNGHVVHDIPTSGVHYRAVHTSDKGDDKLPDWLKKSYMETEKSLEIQEEGEGSRNSSVRSDTKPLKSVARAPTQPPPPQPQPQQQPQPQPQRRVVKGVKAHVSPKHSNLDSREVLRVSEEFTIIDFVDAQQQKRRGQPSHRSYLDRDYRRPTEITRYSAPTRDLADTSQWSTGSSYVPPVSTSTPRSPPDATQGAQGSGEEIEHHRMRKPDEGCVSFLPSTSSKGDFLL